MVRRSAAPKPVSGRRAPLHRARVVSLTVSAFAGIAAAAAVSLGIAASVALRAQSGVDRSGPSSPQVRLTASGDQGYWLAAADGGIFPFGNAAGFGSTGGTRLNSPIVSMAASPDGAGYWLVAGDGGIFPFGDAAGYGSTGRMHLNYPVVDIAATASGRGYWLVAEDGGIFPFGDAAGYGSTGGMHLRQPIVGIAATRTGHGYWLVARDGGIFPFGDAAGYGSTGGMTLNRPIVAMAATPTGHGYWLVASDGGIFPFGDAGGYGSTGGKHLHRSIIGMASTSSGRGYWLVAGDGGVFPFGDAQGLGSTGSQHLNQPIVTIAASPQRLPLAVATSLSPATLIADGSSTAAVTSTVTGENGDPISGDTVAFSVSGSGCGSVAPVTAATNQAGQASTVYTASTTPAHCTVVATELTGGHSVPIGVTQVSGPPTSLVVTPSSSSAVSADQGHAGVPFSVSVRDAHGNPVVGAQLSVSTSLAHGSVGAGGTTDATGDYTGALVDGTAGDSGTLTATVQGTGVHGSSGAVSITPGAPAHLAVTTQPVTTVAGASINPALRVAVEDAEGNVVTSSADALHVALGANPGGSTLSGTLTRTAVNGVAAFSDLSLNRAGHGYTLVAGASGFGTVPTSAFDIIPGPATALVVSTAPPSSVQSTSPFSLGITAVDAYGNAVTSASPTIGVGIGDNPGAGTLSGTTTIQAVNGVASFSGLSIDRSGDGYTLVASSPGLGSVTTGGISIRVGPVDHLSFGQQPTSQRSQTAISPAVTVDELDAGGNLVTTAADQVTVAIGTNPAGGTLAGTLTRTAGGGVATFSDLSVDKAGSGYTLAATGGGLSGPASSAFAITPGPVSQLVFTHPFPTSAQSGAALSPAVGVDELDAAGNLVDVAADTISMAIGSNPAGGTLSGTTSQPASGGVATFSDLSIDKAASGYTLKASTSSLNVSSDPLSIVPGAPTQLVVTTQPPSTPINSTNPFGLAVSVEDAHGNVVTGATPNVSVAIDKNPGAGTLSGTRSVTAAAGVAGFSGLSIDKQGTGYTLITSSPGLSSATSDGVTIAVGPVSQLAFGQQPVSQHSQTTLSPAVSVDELDAGGNLVTGATDQISVAIGSNPSSGTLAGTLTRTASGGVATFDDLSIDKAAACDAPAHCYTLLAGSGSWTPVPSHGFAITPGAVSHLGFGQQPSSAPSDTVISPAITVDELDAAGNLVSDATDGITMSISGNPSHGTLAGTVTRAASGGVARFDDLSIDKAAACDTPARCYTILATSGSWSSPASSGFAITVGPVTRLAFGQQPTSTQTGTAIGPAVTLDELDAGGNVVTTAADSISVALSTNPGGATLGGTLTRAATSGVASFADLSVDKPGTGYALTATSGAWTSPPSSPFTVVGPATHFMVSSQSPGYSPTTFTATSGGQSATFTVTLVDALNDPVTTGGDTSDVIAVTLSGTPGRTPDGGNLGGLPDNTAPVTVDLRLVNGSGTFTYTAPLLLPLGGGSGSITYGDNSNGKITPPERINIAD